MGRTAYTEPWCLSKGALFRPKEAKYYQAQEWGQLYVYSPVHLCGVSRCSFTLYIHTDPNYISELQSLQSAKYFSSNALHLKVASGGSFKITNIPETGCLHYKGSDMTRMKATLEHLTPLSAWLMFYWNLSSWKLQDIFNIISSVNCEYNHQQTQMHNLYEITNQP